MPGGVRPAALTRERIVEAGIALTMLKVTVRGVAQQLGVSELSVYRHVKNIAGLRRIVANGICLRAEFPPPKSDDPREALHEHAAYMCEFTRAYPGIAEYLLRRNPVSDQVLVALNAHHEAFAQKYGWDLGVSSVILSTITRYVVVGGSFVLEQEPSHHPELVELIESDRFPALAAGIALGVKLGDPMVYTTSALIDGLLRRFVAS